MVYHRVRQPSLTGGTAAVDDHDLTVISLGAGTQSSAMLMLAARGGLPDHYHRPDAAIFADTGDEPQTVYQWLERLETEVCEPSGIPLHIVRHPSGESLSEHTTRTDGDHNRMMVPAFLLHDDGSSGIARRQCSREFKIKAVRRKVREMMDERGLTVHGAKVRMLIGISVDEAGRMKPSRVGYIDNGYPLVDLRWSRQRCATYLTDDVGFGDPPRSACVYCPYRSNHEWRRLREEEPEAWQAAVEYEKRLQETNAVWADRDPDKAYDGAQMFLHSDRVPLPMVDLSTPEDHGQMSMFDSECEGICGV